MMERQEQQLKKGHWSAEEDQKLVDYIRKHGHSSWRQLPMQAGLQRCGKTCRRRWTDYLRPDIKRGNFSCEEDQTIIELHAILGNKWSAIAAHLKGRTDNEIKNNWNTHLKRNLLQMGIDPMTHTPLSSLNQHAAHNTNINLHYNMLTSAGASIASPSVQQQHYSGAPQLNALKLDEHLLQIPGNFSLAPQNELNIYSSPLHRCEIKGSSAYECLNQQKEMTTIFNGENNTNVAEEERIKMPMLNPHFNMPSLDTLSPFTCPDGYQRHILLEDSNGPTDASVGFITGISESNHNGSMSL